MPDPFNPFKTLSQELHEASKTLEDKAKLDKLLKDLKKALEAGGYNAAPAPLSQGGYSMGYILEPLCTCGSTAEKYKLGHKPGCAQWTFSEACVDNSYDLWSK